ncbi:Uncharacterized protein TPAR_00130 [Tolypocladium paradoxum]|uniref:Uncharacterized protein n=1 Tax=Tolypocladium paradoxum TaxID=94208 RepID=A0A2S4LB75_9HYPO|nr:Uncharacterized protein TPAR_00130 [Tolypocladium paradoxum]
MSSLFRCHSVKPYRARHLSHEAIFTTFMAWSSFPQASSISDAEKPNLTELNPPFAMQLVRQVNFGPLESKRHFALAGASSRTFVEIAEGDLIQANFQKLDSHVHTRTPPSAVR